MKPFSCALLSFTLLFSGPILVQEEPPVEITSPENGQVIQGLVIISGRVPLLDYSYYELSFAYDNNPEDTWFELPIGNAEVEEEELGVWDTTALTDGNYQLRLQVVFLDGSVEETTVTGLRVRNYTPLPTPTDVPTATAVSKITVPTARWIVTEIASVTASFPTPTPLAENPAGLEPVSVYKAVGQGAILVLLIFLSFGLLLRLRRE